MTEDVKCPYCNEWQEIDHDDGYGYEEDRAYEQECTNCDKTFIYYTSIIFHYYAKKAPCKNGGQHNFKPTNTYPKECTKMECEYCEERRKPTEEEMKKIMKG